MEEKQISTKVVQGQLSTIQRPRTIDETMAIANILCKCDLVPECFRGKPQSVFLAIGFGDSLGLNPFQSMQSIMVVKGMPTIWGKTTRGLILTQPDLEYIKERPVHEIKEKQAARCEIKRKGHEAVIVEFTVADATTAGLWKKVGTWTTFPWLMLQYKAAHLCEDKAYADVLKGIRRVEEVMDYVDTGKVVEAQTVETDMMPKRKKETAPEQPKLTGIQNTLGPNEITTPEPLPEEVIDPEQAKELVSLADQKGILVAKLIEHVIETYKIKYPYQLPKSKFDDVKKWIEEK